MGIDISPSPKAQRYTNGKIAFLSLMAVCSHVHPERVIQNCSTSLTLSNHRLVRYLQAHSTYDMVRLASRIRTMQSSSILSKRSLNLTQIAPELARYHQKRLY